VRDTVRGLQYTAHERATVPESSATSAEFSSLCPDTADCLWRGIPKGGALADADKPIHEREHDPGDAG